MGAARVAIGAALLALAAWRLAPRGDAAWSAKGVLAGAAGVAAYQLTFFAAVADTGVAVGTVVALGSGPVFAGLLGRAVHGERLTSRWMVATALAVAGVAVLVAAGSAAQVRPAGSRWRSAPGCRTPRTPSPPRACCATHAPEAVMARLFGFAALLLAPRWRSRERDGWPRPAGSRSPSTSAPCRPHSPMSCSRADCATCPPARWRR